MRKLFFLPLLALFTIACSTDSEFDDFQENGVVSMTSSNANRMAGTPVSSNCVSYLNGSNYIDVTQGLNNPRVVFVADIPNQTDRIAKTSFILKLEVETLTDCENLNSGTGTITNFSMNFWYPTATDPEIKLLPSQLPTTECYRWRLIVEGTNVSTAPATMVPCTNVTPWYDAPLF